MGQMRSLYKVGKRFFSVVPCGRQSVQIVKMRKVGKKWRAVRHSPSLPAPARVRDLFRGALPVRIF